jgi:hypothetical protein
MNNLTIYCITNKVVPLLEKTNYNIGWVGKEIPPSNYISCNSGDNIFYKEQYYSELTFQYWYWKNKLNINNKNWIGFCQRRRFWIDKNFSKKKIDTTNFLDCILKEVPSHQEEYESIICDPISVNKVKKIKMLKRGIKSILKKPEIFFNEKKRSIAFHFDMHHGYGNLNKAIEFLNIEDRSEFFDFVNNSTSFNPHIMFIAKPKILDEWFNTLFPWLSRCEEAFKFEELKGYDTQRLYAYLAERYLSFWFKKYTKYLENPWVFIDN